MSPRKGELCPIWNGNNDADIQSAAEALRKGWPVAFPTETVYGLGAIATDDEAVARIFAAKGRPSDNPLILHVADGPAGLRGMAANGQVPEVALKLAKAFWPGPLSICIKANPAAIGKRASAGLDTVVIRVPNHPVALALLRALGPNGDVPVAAPSANASGRPSPTSAAHVLEDIGRTGLIGGVVDGGECKCSVGIESTIVDCSVPGRLTILRPGGITKKMVEECVGVEVHDVPSSSSHTESSAGPKAPGMKYRHYAPKAELQVITGSPQQVTQAVRDAIAHHGTADSVGLMAPDTTIAAVRDALGGDASQLYSARCGATEHDLEGWARDLYAAMRLFDERDQIKVIVAQGTSYEGLGAAVMNRLMKAASSKKDLAPEGSR